MKRLCCAFSGHRPKFFPWGYDEDDKRCVELKATLAQEIGCLTQKGYTDFLSGMAPGVDMWAAQSVLEYRDENPNLRLHCILPCVGQEKSWPESLKSLYFSILDQADSRIYTSRKYYRSCMLDRNKFMVDHADLLLAVYAGVPRSGTAATINYAHNKKKKILILDPLTGNLCSEVKK